MVAARSKILQAKLLDAERNDEGLRQVVLPNATAQACQLLLSYIYSDTIHPSRNGMSRIRLVVCKCDKPLEK